MPRPKASLEERPLPDWLLKLEARKKETKKKERATASKKVSVEEKFRVDASNIRTGWKGGKAIEEEEARRQRRVENAREPTPKSYPFEIRPTDVFEDSPVAQFALTHGTRKKFMPPRGDVAEPEAAEDEAPASEEVAQQTTLSKKDDEDDISKLLHSHAPPTRGGMPYFCEQYL